MDPPYIRTGTTEEAESYLAQKGEWIVAHLQQSIGWTQKPITIEYAGQTFLLLPEQEQFLPAIAMRGEPTSCRRAILEFASALTWSSGGYVAVESWTSGIQVSRTKRLPVLQNAAYTFQVDYLPAPSDKNHRLALALFHEGSTLIYVHVAYSFLSYYKIVNLVSGQEGSKQKAWINASVPAIKHHRASQRLAELKNAGEDIGRYIYQSCRCAIAHAGDPRNPVIDPHDFEDERRLRADLPLIISLAEIAIEQMGIKTSQTVYQEHRYELSGFEKLFTPEAIEVLKFGGTPIGVDVRLPNRISLRLWGHARYPCMEELTPTAVQGANGTVAIKCMLREKGCFANVLLDFPRYRLTATIQKEEGFKDDGSAEFIETMLETEQFYWDWNCNGCLEVWAEGTECLGRCEPFIPINVEMDHNAHNESVAAKRAEIARRPRRQRS